MGQKWDISYNLLYKGEISQYGLGNISSLVSHKNASNVYYKIANKQESALGPLISFKNSQRKFYDHFCSIKKFK